MEFKLKMEHKIPIEFDELKNTISLSIALFLEDKGIELKEDVAYDIGLEEDFYKIVGNLQDNLNLSIKNYEVKKENKKPIENEK